MDDTSGNLDDIVPGVIFENASLFLGEILAGGTSANRPGPKGFRPLHDAAAYGHLDCVRVLLDHQATVNAAADDGSTPLHRAASGDNREDKACDLVGCVRLLIERGASIDAKNDAGSTPIQCAHDAGNEEVFRCLKEIIDERRAEKERKEKLSQLQRLVRLCEEGDVDSISALLKEAKDIINMKDDSGYTALYRSCEANQLPSVQSLLAAGAHLRLEGDTGYTPLDICARDGKNDFVVELVACTQNGATASAALLLASESGHNEIVEYLLAKQVAAYKAIAGQLLNGCPPPSEHVVVPLDVNHCNADGMTALHLACHNAHSNVVRSLLKHAPSNVETLLRIDVDRDEVSPSSLENDPVLSRMRENLVLDLEVRAADKSTAFHVACRKRCFDVIEQLAVAGADVNVRQRADNCFVDACVKDDVELAHLLLRLGANDSSAADAFFHALKHDDDELVACLLAFRNVSEDQSASASKSGGSQPIEYVAAWNDVRRDGRDFFKATWVDLATKYVDRGQRLTQPAVITRLHLKKNGLTELPLALFQLPHLRFLDVSFNSLEELPSGSAAAAAAAAEATASAATAFYIDDDDGVGGVGGDLESESTTPPASPPEFRWTCQSLTELNVSSNALRSLPSDAFRVERLVRVKAQQNRIASLPVDMWLAPALEEINLSNNDLEELPTLVDDSEGVFVSTTIDSASTSLPRRYSDSLGGFRTRGKTKRTPSISSSLRTRAVTASGTIHSGIRASSSRKGSNDDEDDDEDDDRLGGGGGGGGGVAGSGRLRTYKSPLKQLYLNGNKLSRVPVGLPCLAQRLERLEMSDNYVKDLGHPCQYPLSINHLAMRNNDAETSISAAFVEKVSRCYGIIKDETGALFSPSTIGCSHRRHAILPNLHYLILPENKLEDVPLSFTDKHVEKFAEKKDESDVVADDNRSLITGGASSPADSANGLTNGHANVERHLFPNLELLDASFNCLREVPHSCWHLPVGELILKGNKGIVDLPSEMGLMNALYRLDVDDQALECVPTHVDRSRTKNIVLYLRSKRDKAREYRRLKLMVVGRQERGKSTVIRRLKEGCDGSYDLLHFNKRRDGVYASEPTEDSKKTQMSTVGVDLGLWKYGKPLKTGLFERVIERAPEIEFLTWDFAGQEDYYATHQCFLSKRSLYLVLWNVNDGDDGINELESWLRNIQARAPGATVILVGSHIDVKRKGRSKDWLECIRASVAKRYMVGHSSFLQSESGLPNVTAVAFVGCETREGVDRLRRLIYDTAANIAETRGSKRFKLLEQLLPQMYVQLEDRVVELAITCRQRKDIPVVVHQDFKDRVADIVSDPEELAQAVDFLHQNGTLLHYNDQSLRHLYFIDPQWLCDILAHVVTVDAVNPIRFGLLSYADLPRIFTGPMFAFRDEYINLLTKFEVAVPVGLDRDYLLVPSKLADSYAGALSIQPYNPKTTASTNEKASRIWLLGSSFVTRFYYLIYVPSGFWPRVISRFLSSTEFSRILASAAVVTRERGNELRDGKGDRPSACMLTWSYWKTGVELRANSELILSIKEVLPGQESILGPKATENEGTLSICMYGSQPDVLTREKYRWIEVCAAQLALDQDLDDRSGGGGGASEFNGSMTAALLSASVDLVDGLLEDWYEEISNGGCTPEGIPRLTRIVACTKCVDGMKMETPTQEIGFVFTVQECSWKAQTGETMICPRHGDLHVGDVAPDLVFDDLNVNLVVSSDQIQEGELIDKSNADVLKGWYYPEGKQHAQNREEVAIKKIQKEQLVFAKEGGDVRHYDMRETISTKAYKSYIDTRREVSVLAQLNHPRIVRLVGIRLDPCGLVLEWAPKGSLESILRKYSDVECLVNPRPLRQLIIQVAEGLSYLHEKGIVYRDLKSANVLVWKFPEPTAQHCDVQVKLADFGISRSADPRGRAKGDVGTQGFQAPEIVLYGGDEDYGIHVDIYSFAMLLYEVLSLKHPFSEYMRMEVENMVRKSQRPTLPKKRFQYPLSALDLMKRCWAQRHDSRPLTPRILSIARSDDFLRLLDIVQLPADTNVLAACVYSPEATSCENGGDDNVDAELFFDEIWWSSRQSDAVANVESRLCRAEYDAKESEASVTHKDVPTSDLLGSVCVVHNHIVAVSHSMDARLFVYGAASSFPHEMTLIRSFAIPGDLSEFGNLRQLLYGPPPLDQAFILFNNGVVISVKGERLIAAAAKENGDPFADASTFVCDMDEDQQLFCAAIVGVGGSGAKSESAQNVNLWCGLSNAQIAVIRCSDGMQLQCIDVELEPDSFRDFSVSSVNCLSVVHQSSGETIVWGSIQPGTVVYGWRSTTKRLYSTINSMDYIEDHLSGARSTSAPKGCISVLQSQGSQLYIGTANGCILVVNDNRVTQLLHAHLGTISVLVPFTVAADDRQWLPRFWRRCRRLNQNADEAHEALSHSKRSLLLSFGTGSRHEQINEGEGQGRKSKDRSHIMIWLVDKQL